ncbi:hypothetical protein HO173_005012 [Letharia columbiana]|uniref:Gluconokinase n=2 Tax=Letharia TaxID=112415 RepID=A0A8H6FXT3_9LECA|nr:uncharacterized protein HO173_005012 [Letharia columbiana]KAF6236721.1 hypothetical protein HO173_005012 [Letharia columbiana]
MTMVSVTGGHTLPIPPSPMDYASTASVKQIHGALAAHHHRHMWIITGPAGCGKSTVAQYVAKELSIPYIEGDDYHSDSNKQKMSQGSPLTDIDRWDWLITLREAAVARLSPSKRSANKRHDGVVVTCSALKRKYRDVIRIAAYNDHDVMVHFIYLRADADVLLARVTGRKGHYMKSAMVRSQMEALEEPDATEQGRDVLEVDCGASLTQVQQEAVRTVREVLADDQ